MSFLLGMSRIYLPRFIQKRRLSELFRVTADAFQCQAPQLKGYSPDGFLTEYARFTSYNAEQSIRQGKSDEVKERLFQGAYRIGKNIREELKIQTMKDVMQACKFVYKALKIDFRGDLEGQINIQGCFFSSFYTSDICHIISSLDAGLVAGLSEGLRLEFSQRITEGKKCCRAHLITAGSSL